MKFIYAGSISNLFVSKIQADVEEIVLRYGCFFNEAFHIEINFTSFPAVLIDIQLSAVAACDGRERSKARTNGS